MISGIRWYRSYPTPLTQLVLASGNTLWVGDDPNAVYPYASLTELLSFPSVTAAAPVGFAAVRDPAALNASGADVLVICGLSGPYGFASQVFTLSGTPAAGQAVTVTMVNGPTTVTTPTYTTLPTDNLSSLAQAIVTRVNESYAVVSGGSTPFLQQVYALAPTVGSATVTFGALESGTPGNTITVGISISSSGAAVTPAGATALSGGGATTSAPLKYDGTTISGLSSQIQNAFTGCVSWHNHVWYWGDPANPDTLFASDINQPEGFSFMKQFGGYDIGVGDGDPSIRACVPIGNNLYVLKANSIWAVTGYDFQAGEYQFQLAPAIRGHGTLNAYSVAVLNNALVFWDGHAFYRLRSGAFDLEHIGAPIPISEAAAARGNQTLVRAVAGSFIVSSLLNESYTSSTAQAQEVLDSLAYFAMDVGNGVADTVFVFDDEASKQLKEYAWAKWSGWHVGAWIPFGGGPNVGDVGTPSLSETPLLCWANNEATNSLPQVFGFGTNATADSGASIPFLAQTGWITLPRAEIYAQSAAGSALSKELHRMFVEVEANGGVVLSVTITPSITVEQSGYPEIYNSYQTAFAATGGAPNAEMHQTLVAAINPYLRADGFLIAFGENTTYSSFEIVEVVLDYIESAWKP